MQATAFPAMGQPVQPIALRPATPPAACPTVDFDAGLVMVGPEWLSVTMKGRLLIRNVCMVFDRYLAAAHDRPRHSQTV